MKTIDMLVKAKEVSKKIGILSDDLRNLALENMAASLLEDEEIILKANKIDVDRSRGIIADVMVDRLLLNKERIASMAKGLKDVKNLPDPLFKTISEFHKENGLLIKKVSVPMGVIGVIYESRPNVTSDVASLCLKSGNVTVLRSGKEAFNSAKAIVDALHKGLIKTGLPCELINLVLDTSRESADILLKANGYLDLLIPRGGKGLIDHCLKNATVPIIQTGTGICHAYVDKDADFKKALDIIDNGKTSRPSVCNALECCLVNEAIADKFLPLLNKRLHIDKNVELRLDEKALKIIDGVKANEDDYDKEFLDYIMAVKVVKDVDEAIEHIALHSTGHSEVIISENEETCAKFVRLVDSAAVYINASTRFSDGGEFGLGCEIGISTQKLHARGPMGLNELTSYKYIVTGQGQIR